MSASVVMEHSSDALIHELNQRYRQEFDRAEALQAELNDIKRSRWWPWFNRLREFSYRWRNTSFNPISEHATTKLTSSPSMAELFQPVANHQWNPSQVSIIIPFRDQHQLMHRCLSMLHRTVPRAEIILVDNGSKDYQTRKLIEEARVQRQARLLRIDEEFNYSKLCNAGAAESQRELLLFLNNDVLAMQPAWLQAMLEVLNDQTVGIVGATLLYPDRTLQHVGLAPTGPSGAWVHPYRYEPESCTGFQHELRHIRTVPAVTGACLMIPRDLFNALNGFDPQYPVTHNDVDLCQRVRKLGKKVAITPFAKLWHFESLTRGYSREASRC